MPVDTIPFTATPSGQSPEIPPPAAGEKLLIDMAELAHLTSLSVRHLRRLDSSRDIPGRVVAGRAVRFQLAIIREWVRAGLPGRDQWAALQKRNGKR
jgi:predicted DNA-binding transcriptional regulator AlpA